MGCKAYFYIYLGHIMQKIIIYLSHIRCRSTVTCHILRKLSIFHLTCGVTKFKMGNFFGQFEKDGDMLPILNFPIPPYFCDMCYFCNVRIYHLTIKRTFIKEIIGLVPILSSFLPNLLLSIFQHLKNIFSAPFLAFSQNY